uniref:Ig-like domain-containing protein n=1 Tax=Cyprinus carpio TaxID=7962 RepID=A0A8C2QAW2_CYPCA
WPLNFLCNYTLICENLCSSGVCADADVLKSVSVKKGDSVTLNSDLTGIRNGDLIQWWFSVGSTLIAEINKQDDSMTVHDDVLDGRFRDRLKLDKQTGSLTITDIRTEHAGNYEITGICSYLHSLMFAARLPVPVISRNCSSSSSSSSSQQNCSLVCSVVNVRHVTLSWYKGNSLFLSLPLETQHLDITQLCHTCSDPEEQDTQILLYYCSLFVMCICLPLSMKFSHSELQESLHVLLTSDSQR